MLLLVGATTVVTSRKGSDGRAVEAMLALKAVRVAVVTRRKPRRRRTRRRKAVAVVAAAAARTYRWSS